MPDGKYLIATEYVNQGRKGAPGGGMALFDLSKKTFAKMAAADAQSRVVCGRRIELVAREREREQL